MQFVKRGSQPIGIKIMSAHIYVALAKPSRTKRVITFKNQVTSYCGPTSHGNRIKRAQMQSYVAEIVLRSTLLDHDIPDLP